MSYALKGLLDVHLILLLFVCIFTLRIMLLISFLSIVAIVVVMVVVLVAVCYPQRAIGECDA